MSSKINTIPKSMTNIILKVILYSILILIAAVTLIPLLWTLASSFRSNEEIFGSISPFTIRTLIPQKITFESYISLFAKRQFYRPVFNTVFVAGVNIFIGCIINSLAGFAFAKFKFKFKNLLFALVMISVMVPFEAVAIPLYSVVNKFGWIDSYKALLMPAFASGMVIFLFKQFFEDIPDSLLESATIDGAGWARIYYKIILPLSKPVLVTASLMVFVGQWESFLWPLMSARNKALKVIQVALSDFRMEHATFWSELFAASIIAAIIPVLILIPFQKYYIRGIASSGMKE